MTGDAIRLSAKNLGALALPDCCPRCFVLKLRLRQRLPFAIFPGIFSSIDAYTKHVVQHYFDTHGAPPPWLAELGPLAGYRPTPHHSRFCWHDRRSNIQLTGTPDAVFVRGDGSLTIADYKTARLTNQQDSLFPQYEAQLEGYAVIAERTGFGSVAGLALIYTEPMTAPADAATRGNDDGFDMGFTARIVPVRRRPGLIDDLLRQARTLCDLPELPPGRPECEDCRRVAALVAAAGIGRAAG